MMGLVSSDELATDVTGAEALLERHQVGHEKKFSNGTPVGSWEGARNVWELSSVTLTHLSPLSDCCYHNRNQTCQKV